MNRKTQTGFTLYELLTTLLIVGVVLSIGIPNMLAFRQNSRITAAANDMHSSFHLARTEASRSKANVSICASNDSMTANPTCAGNFEDGWIVFHDTDGDVVLDAGEGVIRRFPAMNPAITVTTPAMANYFSYGPTGQGRGNVTGTAPTTVAIICDDRGNIVAAGGRSSARVLVVTPLGRATVLHDVGQVNSQGGC